MKLLRGLLLLFCALFWMPLPSHADDELYGMVQQMPENRIGAWVIGGQRVVVTERTQIEEDDGRIRVGTCVEVEYEGKIVEEIEHKPIGKCKILL